MVSLAEWERNLLGDEQKSNCAYKTVLGGNLAHKVGTYFRDVSHDLTWVSGKKKKMASNVSVGSLVSLDL